MKGIHVRNKEKTTKGDTIEDEMYGLETAAWILPPLSIFSALQEKLNMEIKRQAI